MALSRRYKAGSAETKSDSVWSAGALAYHMKYASRCYDACKGSL